MSGTGQRNAFRARAIAVSRSFKDVFRPGGASRWLRWLMLVPALRAWSYRVVFTADGTVLRRTAEHVLADLRDFSFARTSAFDPDPIIMARRQGRRDVWLRISNYLTLDEAAVQHIMEIDYE